MSLLGRILPWRGSRAERARLSDEVRATGEALAANIAGLARAMEDRFVALSERVDGLRDAQSADVAQAMETLGERVDGALNELRASLDARLDASAAQAVGTLSERLDGALNGLKASLDDAAARAAPQRDALEVARVLRDLKRDLGAQISLSSFEAAAEIRSLASGFRRAAPGHAPEATPRPVPGAAAPSA